MNFRNFTDLCAQHYRRRKPFIGPWILYKCFVSGVTISEQWTLSQIWFKNKNIRLLSTHQNYFLFTNYDGHLCVQDASRAYPNSRLRSRHRCTLLSTGIIVGPNCQSFRNLLFHYDKKRYKIHTTITQINTVFTNVCSVIESSRHAHWPMIRVACVSRVQ